MNTQHTPGPWTNFDGPAETIRIFAGADRAAVADCIDGITGADTARAFANARLIAAAPDLLAALKNLVTLHPAYRGKPIGAPGSAARIEQDFAIRLENEARAAIAKATQEPRQ